MTAQRSLHNEWRPRQVRRCVLLAVRWKRASIAQNWLRSAQQKRARDETDDRASICGEAPNGDREGVGGGRPEKVQAQG
ncbi:hypothetical protein NDU88_008712 [Pleurodeles waltl]|uniref:Uncharacterized protein n=1 Tax=Pleurodeles waltl TaxID=8319 RepID=A0AAV7NZR2_PLEWA|nr:hypothetical protein NDU88_008712 [Pleurodeles waltl]